MNICLLHYLVQVEIVNGISWIDIISLIFSSIALYISYISYKKLYSKIKITVTKNSPNEAFIYDHYIYIKLKLYNPSSIPIDILKIETDKYEHRYRDYKDITVYFNKNSFSDFPNRFVPWITTDDFLKVPMQIEPYGYSYKYVRIIGSFKAKNNNNYFYKIIKIHTSSNKVYKKNVKVYECLNCNVYESELEDCEDDEDDVGDVVAGE